MDYNNYLYHHGIKGMKWGVRRYQNKDGSLTPAGKRRIKEDGTFKSNKEYRKEIESERYELRKKYNKKYGVDKAYDDADEEVYKRAEKLGYDPADMNYEESKEIYAKADRLASKSYKAVESEMRQKYGKDYDAFVKREKRIATTTVVGGLALTAAITVGTVKVVDLAGKAIIDLGLKGVEKLLTK